MNYFAFHKIFDFSPKDRCLYRLSIPHAQYEQFKVDPTPFLQPFMTDFDSAVFEGPEPMTREEILQENPFLLSPFDEVTEDENHFYLPLPFGGHETYEKKKHAPFFNHYDIRVVEETEQSKQIVLSKEYFHDFFEEKAFVRCTCGFKGNTSLTSTMIFKETMQKEILTVVCPSCGNEQLDNFHEHTVLWECNDDENDDYNWYFYHRALICAHGTITKTSATITLDFALKDYQFKPDFNNWTEVLEIENYSTSEHVVSLVYHFQKRTLYWREPREKISRTIPVANFTEGELNKVIDLRRTKEGHKLLIAFLDECLLSANIHPKKRTKLMNKLNEKFSNWKDFKNDLHAIHAILIYPQLEVIDDTHFLVSLASAPSHTMTAIQQASASIKHIFENQFDFCNKRLLNHYHQHAFHLVVVDFFRPLFQNDQFLMDIVCSTHNYEAYIERYRVLHKEKDIHKHVFLVSKKFKQSMLPLFFFFKKKYKNEKVFRDVLLEVLRSEHCHGDFYKCIRFLKDVQKLEQGLLEFLPANRMPKRTSLLALHDAYVKAINENSSLIQSMDELKNGYGYDETDCTLEYQEKPFTISLIKTPSQLSRIGVTLNNCVRTYNDSIQKGYKYIFVLEEAGTPCVCIEVRRGYKQLELMQCSGWNNSKLATRYKACLNRWITKHHIEDRYGLVADKEFVDEVLPKQVSASPASNQSVASFVLQQLR